MPLGHQLGEVAEGLGELGRAHVRLARLELAEDARFVGLRIAIIAALAPLTLVGYAGLCVALALLLRRVMPVELAFALLGLVNLLGGVGGIVAAARQLGARKLMNQTLTELEDSSALVLWSRSPPP